MPKNKKEAKHVQVMKLCIMTDEDVFNDKTSIDEMMEIVAEHIENKKEAHGTSSLRHSRTHASERQ